MEIEEPEKPIDIPEKPKLLGAASPAYETIGEFYAAIAAAIRQQGKDIFTGEPARQVGSNPVTGVESALAAIDTISVQGEGTPTSPKQGQGYAHYYLFAELYHGMEIVADTASPVGYWFDPSRPIAIDDDSDVIQMVDNPQDVDMSSNPEAVKLADDCDRTYTEMLRLLDKTFDGDPDSLDAAEGLMRDMGEQIQAVLRQPLPSSPGKFAGPRFRWVGA